MKKYVIFVVLATGLIFITQGCSLNSTDAVTEIVESADAEKIDVASINVQDAEPSLDAALVETSVAKTTETSVATEKEVVTPPVAENKPKTEQEITLEDETVAKEKNSVAYPVTAKAKLRPRSTNKMKAPTKSPEPASVATVAQEASQPSAHQEAQPTPPPQAEFAPPPPPPASVSDEALAATEKKADLDDVVAQENTEEGLNSSSLMLMGALGALVALLVFVVLRKKERVQLNKNIDILK